MPVLIAILAHNNLALTRAAITSALLQEYAGPSYPGSQKSDTTGLVVIDNASTDATPQWLASARGFSTVMFDSRQSVAYCWNYILEWAFSPLNSNHYEGVLIMNNDTVIRPDTVQWLMADPASFVTAISVRSESELGFPVPPTTRRPHPDFSCFMIKPHCWKKVGRFDEGFDLAHVEDNDYHVRMHFAGIEAVCLDLPFVHHGASTVRHSDKAEQRLIQRAADKNRARFIEMYGCAVGSKEYEDIFTANQ